MSAAVTQSKTKDRFFHSCDAPILHITSASFEISRVTAVFPEEISTHVETLLPTYHLLVNPNAVVNQRVLQLGVNRG